MEEEKEERAAEAKIDAGIEEAVKAVPVYQSETNPLESPLPRMDKSVRFQETPVSGVVGPFGAAEGRVGSNTNPWASRQPMHMEWAQQQMASRPQLPP